MSQETSELSARSRPQADLSLRAQRRWPGLPGGPPAVPGQRGGLLAQPASLAAGWAQGQRAPSPSSSSVNPDKGRAFQCPAWTPDADTACVLQG